MKNFIKEIPEEKIKIIKFDTENNSVELISCTEDKYFFNIGDMFIDIVLPNNIIKLEFNLITNNKTESSKHETKISVIENDEKIKINKLIEHLIQNYDEKN